MKAIEKIEVTFQSNVVVHTFFLSPSTLKMVGELHKSMTYKDFFAMVERKGVEFFSIYMSTSVLDEKTINTRLEKVNALGFEISTNDKRKNTWFASR